MTLRYSGAVNRMAEKKRRRLAKGAARGDLASLERLVGKAPLRAVDPCIAALDPDASPEALGIAAGLAGRLRLQGDTAEALRVARAGQRRTPRLRLEEALSAFAEGDDAGTAELCAGDPVVATVLSPLVRAVSVGPASARARKGPRSEATSALHLLASAAEAARAGNVDATRRPLRRIPVPLRSTLKTEAMMGAAHVARYAVSASDQAPGEDETSVVHELVRTAGGSRRLLETLVQEAAATAPLSFAVAAACSAGDAPREVRKLAVRAALQFSDGIAAGAAIEHIRAAGSDGFEQSLRGAALVYEGFSLLERDRAGARRRFEAAIEQGADLTEALRGIRLACVRDARPDQPKKTAHDALRELSRISARLVDALGREAGGAAAALAVAVDTASLLAHASSEAFPALRPTAVEWIERARTMMGQAPAVTARDEVDMAEGVISMHTPERAIELADRVIARNRANTSAWLLKISAARRARLPVEPWILEGAEATRDPELVNHARMLRRRSGTLAAFDGLEPGACSVGTLARELLECLGRLETEEPDPTDADTARVFEAAAAHRRALVPKAREAFDAAFLVGCSLFDHSGIGPLALRAVVRAVPNERASLERLGSLAAHLHDEDDCARAVAALAGVDVGADALASILRGMRRELGAKSARRILGKVAPELTQSALTAARAAAEGGEEDPDADVFLEEVHDLLEPHLCIHEVLDEGLPYPDDAATATDGVTPEDPGDVDGLEFSTQEELLSTMLQIAGVPPRLASELSPEARAALAKELGPIVAAGPSEKTYAQLERVLSVHGMLRRAPAAPKMPQRSQQERNRRKRDRKKGKRR